MVAKDGGIICLITQNSILGEDTAISNRKYIFDNTQVIQFISFPERDNHKKRVFESVKMSVAISLLQKTKPLDNKEFLITVWKEKQMLNSLKHKTTSSDIKSTFPKTLAIPISSNHGFEILKTVKNLENVYYLKSSAGEIDMTKYSDKFSDDKSGYRVITGAQIHKFMVNDKPQQGRIYYLGKDDIPTSGKFKYKSYSRLAFQRITGVDSPIRLIATIVPKNTLLANSCNFVFEEDPIKLRYELGLLNSNLINQIYKITSTNTNVTTSEINSIPIPLVSKELMTKVAGLVDQILGNKLTGNDTKELESKIDSIVYMIYKLSEDDILYLSPSQNITTVNLH
jgi:Alw26I/Eco31I/Esp3I family type II restriction m6 adenine DNA methyltransferase